MRPAKSDAAELGYRRVVRNRIQIRLDEPRARLIREQQFGAVVRQHDPAVEQQRVAIDEIVSRMPPRASDA